MTTIVDGTTGITYPTIAGGTSAVQASSSKVLQVVQGILNISFTSTSTSFVSTGLSLSITPSSTSNKILVMFSVSNLTGNVINAGPILTLYRNSTNLISGAVSSQSLGLVQVNLASGGALYVPVSSTFLDSPATTSSTTYSVYGLISSAGSWTVNATGESTITAMEIAG
jgi:hypothetical protein